MSPAITWKADLVLKEFIIKDFGKQDVSLVTMAGSTCQEMSLEELGHLQAEIEGNQVQKLVSLAWVMSTTAVKPKQ